MNIGIIRLSDTCNFSIVADDNLVFSERLDYKSSMLNHILAKCQIFDVTDLNVIFKTSVINTRPSNGMILSSFRVGKLEKYSVISASDKENIELLLSYVNIGSCKLYDYLSYYKGFSDKTAYIVVDEYFDGQYVCCYINNRNICDYRVCRPDMLDTTVNSIMSMYNCDEVFSMRDIDVNKFNKVLINFNLIDDRSSKVFIAPSMSTLMLPHCATLECASEQVASVDDLVSQLQGDNEVASDFSESRDSVVSTSSNHTFIIQDAPKSNISESISNFMNKLKTSKVKNSAEKADKVNNAEVSSGTSARDAQIISFILKLQAVILVGCLSAGIYLPKSAIKLKSQSAVSKSYNTYVQELSTYINRKVSTADNKAYTYANLYDSIAKVSDIVKLHDVIYGKATIEIVVSAETEEDVKRFTQKLPESVKYVETKVYGGTTVDNKKVSKYRVICKY